ncbi:glycoside hydrolase family 18 protein [Lophiostoma macrostomum CBS 122681]|uniref:chitinase n=1 Tax=Lophiostoma macrostomum CBS 122681 TaxID=1314788 RepID=A0A6A6T8M2_9PLEO|nr:glycoside hydrolase family 18 protein [Lophiostoma macrostomum CBS 122681]
MASTTFASFDPNSKSNIAMYWGQNSFGKKDSQQNLGHYCDNADVDNLADQGGKCKPQLETDQGLGDTKCGEVETDITSCQGKGKTVLLSFGGQTASSAQFKSDDEATTAAQNVWAMFGPNKENSNAKRPSGNASVNGFDLDYETPDAASHMAKFAQTLRELMDAETGKYYLTTAPKCTYPSTELGEVLTSVALDMVFVMFYDNNNDCDAKNYPTGFTFNEWNSFAAKPVNSSHPTRVFLGVPGGNIAAKNDPYYLQSTQLGGVIDGTKNNSNFGGVMLWDASRVFANDDTNFLSGIKGKLKG